MAMKTLNDLFVHTLKDIYYAERQALRAMPKMAKQVQSPELKQAMEQHRTETEGQIERLQRVFEMCNVAARGVRCEAIEGIISEATDQLEEIEDPQVKDAAILAATQAIEHYEITRYGTMISWAKRLNMKDAVPILNETLQEEKKTDKLLSDLAERTINKKAA